MDLFNRKLILPVDVMITIAINIVVAVLGYYLVMAWGSIWALIGQRSPSRKMRLGGSGLHAGVFVLLGDG